MTLLTRATSDADVVCLSHLRWEFVYQRPNHLMARAARRRRVYLIEEPERRSGEPRLEARVRDGVVVVTPIIPPEVAGAPEIRVLRRLVDQLFASEGISAPWLWFYTPMAVAWTDHIAARAVVYDCMDELSAFRFAPPRLRELEGELMARADIVFAGGRSLYEAKRTRHPRAFLFPSSVDAAHFRRARDVVADPPDQATIGRPRIGYFGVIDERIDLPLIAAIAAARPDWQVVMLGPVAKITDEELPRADNIHWLGRKAYAELPLYLGGWDVAIMPFALNESTRHISPTKTPEYLSGGRPVVSTRINDVVHPYGDERLVRIADTADDFVRAIDEELAADLTSLVARADRFLATQSWDATWLAMERLVSEVTASAAAAPDLQAPTSTRERIAAAPASFRQGRVAERPNTPAGIRGSR